MLIDRLAIASYNHREELRLAALQLREVMRRRGAARARRLECCRATDRAADLVRTTARCTLTKKQYQVRASADRCHFKIINFIIRLSFSD